MALGAFEAVELRSGEVKEVGGFFQGEVVLEAKRLEALGEVFFRQQDEAEEGGGVVGGEFVIDLLGCPSTSLRIYASLRGEAP